MRDEDFEQLRLSVREAGKIRRGKTAPSRWFEFEPQDVRAIRKRLGVSQSEFALMIGGEVRYQPLDRL